MLCTSILSMNVRDSMLWGLKVFLISYHDTSLQVKEEEGCQDSSERKARIFRAKAFPTVSPTTIPITSPPPTSVQATHIPHPTSTTISISSRVTTNDCI